MQAEMTSGDTGACLPQLSGQTPIKIILLDDQEFDGRRLERLLSRLEIRTNIRLVRSLRSLEEAIQLERFDLAFIDYQLPVGNGLDAVETLRMSALNEQVPVIMVSGYPRAEVAVRVIQAGCDDYLDKAQISPEVLLKAIEKVLRTRKDVQETGRAAAQELQTLFALGDVRGVAQLRPKMSRIVHDLQSVIAVTKSGPEKVALAQIDRSCMELLVLCDDLLNELEIEAEFGDGECTETTQGKLTIQ